MNPAVQTKVLYQQEQLPIFQNRMYDTETEAKSCPKGDVRLVEDQQTGLVYNAAFHPEWMKYDANYQNEQALSRLFQEHLESVCHIIDSSLGRDGIVEVGCGKGFFLEMLLAKGFNVTGFDPTYEGNNPKVKNKFFEPGIGVRANGLVLRHVLEHIHDPYEFLLQLKITNGGSGKIYIEVPCFDWICRHRAWFDIFYEHVNYFRLSDFQRMFGTGIKSGRLFGEQYLYVVAELASLRKPEMDLNDRVVFPDDFARQLARPSRTGLNHTAIWGGASRGVIFALLKSRAGQPVDIVIDINPAKQGRFLPATGLRVLSPANALTLLPEGSTIYVMNSNYMEEIKEMSHNAFNYIGIDHE